MKWSGDGIVWILALELVPAAIFGSAVAFAGATVLELPRLGVIALTGGVGAFALSWLVLHRFAGTARSLPLATFDQSELERELAKLAEELQQSQAALDPSTGGAQLDELLLDDELPAIGEDELLLEDELNAPQDSRVIRLFDPAAETAGEMQARIERHLDTTPRPQLSDATQELHEALSALRRSLR